MIVWRVDRVYTPLEIYNIYIYMYIFPNIYICIYLAIYILYIYIFVLEIVSPSVAGVRRKEAQTDQTRPTHQRRRRYSHTRKVGKEENFGINIMLRPGLFWISPGFLVVGTPDPKGSKKGPASGLGTCLGVSRTRQAHVGGGSAGGSGGSGGALSTFSGRRLFQPMWAVSTEICGKVCPVTGR